MTVFWSENNYIWRTLIELTLRVRAHRENYHLRRRVSYVVVAVKTSLLVLVLVLAVSRLTFRSSNVGRPSKQHDRPTSASSKRPQLVYISFTAQPDDPITSAHSFSCTDSLFMGTPNHIQTLFADIYSLKIGHYPWYWRDLVKLASDRSTRCNLRQRNSDAVDKPMQTSLQLCWTRVFLFRSACMELYPVKYSICIPFL